MMQLSVIIVNFNTYELTCNCIRSIYEHTTGIEYEIIIVDNAPKQNFEASFKSLFPSIKYLRSERNIGFGSANNLGIEQAAGKYLLLINSDTLVFDDSLVRCLQFMETPSSADIGLLGCKLLNEDHSYQSSFYPYLRNNVWNFLITNNLILYKLFGVQHKYGETNNILQVGDVSGAFMFLRKEVVQKVRAFDPDFFLYCEETEWCRERIAKHFRIIYYPQAAIIHYGGKSAPQNIMYIQAKLSLCLVWYKKGWISYIFFIIASWLNALANLICLPFLKSNDRESVKQNVRSLKKIWPYLFKEVTKYGRGWGSRKEPLIYKDAGYIFFT
jgi:GT2 family glycosyltransferase